MKLVGCKKSINSRWFYSNNRSKAVVPVLVLFYEEFVFRLALCYFVLVFFSPFSILVSGRES